MLAVIINGRHLAFLNRRETLCPGLEGRVWPGPPGVGADRASGDTALAPGVTKVLVVVSPETLVQLLQAQEGLLGPGLDQAQASGSRLECPDQSLATSLGRCSRLRGDDCGRPRRARRLEPSLHVRMLNLRGRGEGGSSSRLCSCSDRSWGGGGGMKEGVTPPERCPGARQVEHLASTGGPRAAHPAA